MRGFKKSCLNCVRIVVLDLGVLHIREFDEAEFILLAPFKASVNIHPLNTRLGGTKPLASLSMFAVDSANYVHIVTYCAVSYGE